MDGGRPGLGALRGSRLLTTPIDVIALKAALAAEARANGFSTIGIADPNAIEGARDRLQAAASALPETARIIGVALNHQKRGKNESYYYYYGSDDSSSSSNGNTPSSSNGAGRSFGEPVMFLERPALVEVRAERGGAKRSD